MKILKQKKWVLAARNVAMFVALGLMSNFAHAVVPAPVFHLDFDGEIVDVSNNPLEIIVGTGEPEFALVTLNPDPNSGPLLTSGVQLRSAYWNKDDLPSGEADAESRITILENSTLNGIANSAGSVVTWVKVLEQGDQNFIFMNDERLLLSDTGGQGEFLGMELAVNPGTGAFGAVQGWGGGQPKDGEPDGPVALTGIWTHIAMTWDSAGEGTIWVNGNPGAPVASSPPFPDSSDSEAGQWYIGNFETQGGRDFTGEMADFAFFDEELNGTEIQAIIDDGVTGAASPGQEGDFDGDGNVDGADFLKWQRDLGDATSLNLWETNFGTTPALPSVVAAPEPASWILVCMMLMAATGRRHPMALAI